MAGQRLERSCQSSLGRAARELFALRLAEGVRFQEGLFRGTTPANTDCQNADLRGRIARKRGLLERLIRRRCSTAVLQSSTSWGNTTDSAVA